MDLHQSHESDLADVISEKWNIGFAVHQLIISEVKELLCNYPNDIQQIEELIWTVLNLIRETNYGRDEFFILTEHLKTIDKKLAGKYIKDYEFIYSSKIST